MNILLLTIIAILLRIFSNPVANLFQKRLAVDHNHPLLVNFLTYLLLSVACLPLLAVPALTQLSADFWIYSLLGGIMGALGNGMLVKALQKGELSVLGPMNGYKSIVGMIIALFLLREIPNGWGLTGVALILVGSFYVVESGGESFSASIFRRREIQLRIGATILSAIEAVFLKKVILASTASLAFVGWCWFGAFFSFILLVISRVNIGAALKRVEKRSVRDYLLLVLSVGTMQFSTNFVFDHMPVGYALSLFQLSAVVTVFLGHKLFQERGIPRKLAGTAIMMMGSLLIILMK